MWTRFRTRTPPATQVLIGLNVALFALSLATGGDLQGVTGSRVMRDGALFGPAVDVQGEWWRIVTSGFLHAGLIHLALNMLALWWLGSMLEPRLGTARFVAVYGVSLVAGSLGALIIDPLALTVGASGAVYGLLGAAIVLSRRAGIPLNQNGLVTLLVLNLLFTLAVPGISVGGHVGGVIGGALAGALLVGEQGRPREPALPTLLASAALVVVVTWAAVYAAGSWTGRL
ncbi:MAG: rhomboid family intramembrane serine protease [Acidimicrobiales bacterium]|nr:rhomboid family intramembrane serine protease [Acidimicrobiales bacterium]